MKSEDLMHFCRYYKGEERNPYEGTQNEIYWRCEYYWVALTMNSADFSNMIHAYLQAGLMDFGLNDGTSDTLKALLFNRYCQYNEMADVDGFKKWYTNYVHPKS